MLYRHPCYPKALPQIVKTHSSPYHKYVRFVFFSLSLLLFIEKILKSVLYPARIHKDSSMALSSPPALVQITLVSFYIIQQTNNFSQEHCKMSLKDPKLMKIFNSSAQLSLQCLSVTDRISCVYNKDYHGKTWD